MFNLVDFGKLGVVGRLDPASAIYAQAQLYMDFTQNAARLNGSWSSAVPLLTTTRASVAQMDSQSGFWGQFAANTARWSDKGLLVEEARTNSLRNNTMVGGVSGTPGTQPTNWSGLVSFNGLTQTLTYGNLQGIDGVYIRYAGTLSGGITQLINFDANTGIAATAGQTWTSSFFWQLTNGTLPASLVDIRNVIRENDAGGAIVLQDAPGAVLPTATLTRNVFTFLLAGGTTANVVNALRIVWPAGLVGGAVDFTFFLGWPQLEQGAFVTSPIKTSTVAVTRAADVIDVAAFVPTNPASLFGECALPLPQSGLFPGVIFIHGANGDSDRMGLWFSGSGQFPASDCTVGGASQAALNGAVIPTNTISKSAIALAVNDFAFTANGAAVGTDSAGSLVTPAKIALGRSLAASHFANGYIRRAAYWNTRLSNAQLQAITA